jgi:hypothetical protein
MTDVRAIGLLPIMLYYQDPGLPPPGQPATAGSQLRNLRVLLMYCARRIWAPPPPSPILSIVRRSDEICRRRRALAILLHALSSYS